MRSLKINNVIGGVLVSMFFAVDAQSLRADVQDDVHPYLTQEFFVDLGMYFPNRTVAFQVNGSLDTPNDIIDFHRDLELDRSDETFALNFGWRFGEKWELATQYFKSSGGRKAVLEEDIEWGDVVFEQGSSVSVGQDFSLLRLFFARRFESSERHEFGVGAGIHWLELGAFVEGDVSIGGGGGSIFARESVRGSAPLPNIGVWYMVSISPKWAFKGRLDWLDASIGDYRGALFNTSLGLNYQVFEHVGIGLNFNIFDLDLSVTKSGWRGRANSTYEGLYANLSIYW